MQAKSSLGPQTQSPFRRIPGLDGQLIPGAPKVLPGESLDLLEAVGPSLRVRWYSVLYTGSQFDGSFKWHPACQWTAVHAGCFGGWG